jgi:hypothetical protein
MQEENIIPHFDIDKIKFSVDKATYVRALDLIRKSKVGVIKSSFSGYAADIQGTELYSVSVSVKNFDVGYCDCYIGQSDQLCKHMVALAVKVLLERSPDIDLEQKIEFTMQPKRGVLSRGELKSLQPKINAAVKMIKYYNGPSKIWFSYQNNLQEGCNRLVAMFDRLPVCKESSDLIVRTLVKIDNKLLNGVDDSDGTVGNFLVQTVKLLVRYSTIDPLCVDSFYKLTRISSSFGWESPLVELINKSDIGHKDK